MVLTSDNSLLSVGYGVLSLPGLLAQQESVLQFSRVEHNIPGVMAGDLDALTEGLVAADRAERLKAV